MGDRRQTLIDYRTAVDAAMKEHFGTDASAFGMGARIVADGYAHDWAPEHLAFWFGENYGLTMISDPVWENAGFADAVRQLDEEIVSFRGRQ